jgi:polycystin 1L2
MFVQKEKGRLTTFPWWCLFIAYGLSFLLIGISILLIIARGIEFRDEKSQKWLISILSGLFSSIFITQPMKVLCLAIFFAFFFRNSNDDKEAKEYIDENSIELNDDEEYLHSNPFSFHRSGIRANRLTKYELADARYRRLKDVQMWSIIREALTYFCFFAFLCVIVYSNYNSNSFLQVQHLRNYFFTNSKYTQISRIDEYWTWLKKDFISDIRAQNWYNKDEPRNLSGFINDKTNRLIGWATMRQLRIKSDLCVSQTIRSICQDDYSLLNEEKRSFQPKWKISSEEEYSSSILKAFKYQSHEELDSYIYIGDHETYSGGGYVYEFRGSLSDLRSNISQLHQLGWIDEKTRAIFIQISLYNPNVQLFTSMTFLIEFLSTGGIYPQFRFEPMNFYGISYLLLKIKIFDLSFSFYIVISIDLYHTLYVHHCLFYVD